MNLTEEGASLVDMHYELVNIALADHSPYFVVNAKDPEGVKSSWILNAGALQGTHLDVQLLAWVQAPIQAMVSDDYSQIWAITTTNQLLTNAPLGDSEYWVPLEPLPGATMAWFTRDLAFGEEYDRRLELVDCLCWSGNTLLLGTFSRCVYRWNGAYAVLEYDGFEGQPPPLRGVRLSGGINALVQAGSLTYALGYGGTVIVRDAKTRRWHGLSEVPWDKHQADQVNVMSGAVGSDNVLRLVIDGGWVAWLRDGHLEITHHLPTDVFAITCFQGDWFVSSLDGCYQVLEPGHSVLVKSSVALGKGIDMGSALLLIDSAHEQDGFACAHLWVRTRTVERWLTQVIARPF